MVFRRFNYSIYIYSTYQRIRSQFFLCRYNFGSKIQYEVSCCENILILVTFFNYSVGVRYFQLGLVGVFDDKVFEEDQVIS